MRTALIILCLAACNAGDLTTNGGDRLDELESRLTYLEERNLQLEVEVSELSYWLDGMPVPQSAVVYCNGEGDVILDNVTVEPIHISLWECYDPTGRWPCALASSDHVWWDPAEHLIHTMTACAPADGAYMRIEWWEAPG